MLATETDGDIGRNLKSAENNICMLIIEDPTVTVKVRTDNVTNNSKDRGTHSFNLNRQMT